MIILNSIWRKSWQVDMRTIVELISATTTKTGLTVRASYNEKWYEKGVKISNQDFAAIPIQCHSFHGDWNYAILPRATT